MSKSSDKPKHRKSSDAIERLNPRQAKYVKAVANGETKKDAALAAGYSESSAENAAAVIEGPDVRAAFQLLIRKRIRPEKIAQRVAEGLDALDTKFFQDKGLVTDSRDVVDWEQRRKYSEMAAKYGGYYVDKAEIEAKVTDESGDRLARLLTAATARLNGGNDAGGKN